MTKEEFDEKLDNARAMQAMVNDICQELSFADSLTNRDTFDISEYLHEHAISAYAQKNEKASLESLREYFGDLDPDEDEDFDDDDAEEKDEE